MTIEQRIEQIEKRLREHEEKLKEVLANAPIMVFRVRSCYHCKRDYYPNNSDAAKNFTFCCAACENGY